MKAKDTLTALADRILKEFVVRLDSNREYTFCDSETERSFTVRRLETLTDAGEPKFKFFLEEYVPNGRMCEVQGDLVVHAWDEPAIRETEARVGANGLMRALREQGLDTRKMVLEGGGFCVGCIYHDSLKECALAIARSLLENKRYAYHRQLAPQEKVRLERDSARASHAYWQGELSAVERSWKDAQELFKGCYTRGGAPLPKETRERILAYLNKPGAEAWHEVRSIVVAGPVSLWQAWCAVDPNAPRSGNGPEHPDAETLRHAIRRAAESRREEALRRSKETTPHGLAVIDCRAA